MAVIGALGDIVFTVSNKTVKTFDNLKWDSQVNYASHSIHLKNELIEYTGRSTDSISFNIYLSAFLGVNPLDEINKLLVAERQGKIMRLVIGNKTYGENKWIIEKLSKELDRYDNKGNLLIAKVSVSLKEYVGR